jgi:hypothetical protein
MEIRRMTEHSIDELEVFYQSPLPCDHRPRHEVIEAYFKDLESGGDERYAWAGVTMAGASFYGQLYPLWSLILQLVEESPCNDSILQAIAAGPLESFLGKFDSEAIEMVEREATQDEKFRRVVTGVWKHRMSDSTWNRVREIQRTVATPLPEMIPIE